VVARDRVQVAAEAARASIGANHAMPAKRTARQEHGVTGGFMALPSSAGTLSATPTLQIR